MIAGALVKVHLMTPQTHFKVISSVPKGKRFYYVAKSPYWQTNPWGEGDYEGMGPVEVPGTLSKIVSQVNTTSPLDLQMVLPSNLSCARWVVSLIPFAHHLSHGE